MVKAKESKRSKAKKPIKTHPCHCNQCGYDWQSKKKHPLHCARCISNKWDQPLIGKKLRKPVPSRMRLAKGRVASKKKSSAKASAAPKKGTVDAPKKSRLKKIIKSAIREVESEIVESAADAAVTDAKPKRAPRAKKEQVDVSE